MNVKLFAAVLLAAALPVFGRPIAPQLSGNYIEVRSCDVYTGSCVANSEMNLGGKEGMLVWSIQKGSWKGTALDGLSVVAVIQADGTLGDQRYNPRNGRAVLILDAKAGSAQQEALQDFARAMAGSLVRDVAEVRVASLEVTLGGCKTGSCAKVKADGLLEISTRCLAGKDHLCGNEENYYPPLTPVQGAFSAYAEYATFSGRGLGLTWTVAGKRSAYLGSFTL